MYTSSPQTFIFKYIFPIVMIGAGAVGFFTFYNSGDETMSNFAIAFGIAFCWISIFLIQAPFRLKSISADEDALKIKTKEGEKTIQYQKIRTVSKFDLSGPNFITIQYRDTGKNELKKISFSPNPKHHRFMKMDEMTEFIIKKAKENNPEFQDANNLKNQFILFLAGLPFFLSMIYFIHKSGFF